MATVGNTYLTLADQLKQTEEGKVTSKIIEMMSEVNGILDDMIVMPCNDGTSHITTMRSGIPEGTFRQLYQGVQPSKGTVKQIKDTTGMVENWSEIDAKLVELAENGSQLRLNEGAAFIEGLSNTMAETVFYGNTKTDPEKFMGLAPRFNDLSAANAGQIIDAGGTGSDNTSVWMVVWGERTCHGLYPKNSKAGISREDKGKVTKTLSDNSMYDVYREKFGWDLGMSVRDYRYVSRIANIDVSDLKAGTVDIYKFMRQAYYALKQRQMIGGRAAIYCNSEVLEALDAKSTSDDKVRLIPKEVEGKEVDTYRKMSIRECEAILNTEARVV